MGTLKLIIAISKNCGNISEFGGAIGTGANGAATISNTTFDSNVAQFGGAIYVGGNAEVIRCLFYWEFCNE